MNPEISATCRSFSSSPRKRESRAAGPLRLPPVQARGRLWTPAFAGVTIIQNESRILDEFAFLVVIPAKAGIQGGRAAAVAPCSSQGQALDPAFAGVTIIQNESRNLSDLPLVLVIPAKAGVQGGRAAAIAPCSSQGQALDP